jgi:hypothetical protein
MAVRAAQLGHDPRVVGPARPVRCIVSCQPMGCTNGRGTAL